MSRFLSPLLFALLMVLLTACGRSEPTVQHFSAPEMVTIPAGTFTQGDESFGQEVSWHADPFGEDGNGDGQVAWRSGAIGREQSLDLSATVTVQGEDAEVSFWLRTSSRYGHYLEFWIDDERQEGWSGSTDWQQVSFPVAAGERSLVWRYVKNTNIFSHKDAVWVDGLTVAGVPLAAGDLTAATLTSSGIGWTEELPQRIVTLTSDYRLSRTQVTNAQYAAMLNWAHAQGFVVVDDPESPSEVRLVAADPRDTEVAWDAQPLVLIDDYCQVLWDNEAERFVLRDVAGHPDGDIASRAHHPMVNVTWFGAQFYAWALNEQLAGPQPIDLRDWSVDHSLAGHRLPTEAEWEYAARGGYNHARYPWWTADPATHTMPRSGEDAQANISGSGSIYATGSWPWTSPVASYPANAFGLYDMAGNAFDWVSDWQALYTDESVEDPLGPASGSNRVVRGGCWFNCGEEARSAFHSGITPGHASSNLGFRLAAPVQPASPPEGDA